LLAVLVLAIGVASGFAQTQITLGPSSGNITFTSNGSGSATVSLGTLTGTAFGTGAAASGPAAYSLTQSGNINMTYNGTFWDITQDNPISFCYGGSGSCDGSLLTGDLQLVSFFQTGKSGTFNGNLEANLTITGGSLAGVFGGIGHAAMLSFTVDLASLNGDLSTTEGSFSGPISAGELKPVPEPATLGMLGTGLMLLGGAIRRRLL